MADQLTLAPLFSEGAIIQGEQPVTIFGWGTPGLRVKVTLGQSVRQTITPAHEKWTVQFPAQAYNQTLTLTVAAASASVTRHVQTGDVYLVAGQSNIEYKMADDADFEAARANFTATNLSFYYTPQVEYETKRRFGWADEPDPRWQKLTAENLGQVSAVAYYALAQVVANHPDRPIGMLQCYKGGTSASSWISEANLKADAKLADAYVKPYEAAVTGRSQADFDADEAKYEATVTAYNQKKAAYIEAHPELSLEAVKMHVGHTPWPPPMQPKSYLRPTGLYHTMVQKTAPYTVKAMVWYQGENDADHAPLYDRLLPRLITEWRRDLGNPGLPVFVIQLPQYQDEPHHAWAQIRQAQWQTTQALNDCTLVSLVDTGEHHNIHPVHKQASGERLGQALLSGEGTPTVVAVDRTADQISLQIAPATSLSAKQGDGIEALIDGTWQPVDFQLDGTTLKVKAPRAKALRYAYRNAPAPAIFNEARLPLSPFLIAF